MSARLMWPMPVNCFCLIGGESSRGAPSWGPQPPPVGCPWLRAGPRLAVLLPCPWRCLVQLSPSSPSPLREDYKVEICRMASYGHVMLLAGPWRGPFLGVLCPTLTSLGDTGQDTGARRVSRVTLLGFFHPLSAACRHRAGAKALRRDTGTRVLQPQEVSEGGTGWQSHLSLPFNECWV